MHTELFSRNLLNSCRLIGEAEDILRFFESGKADSGTVEQLSKEALGYLSRGRKLLNAIQDGARERDQLQTRTTAAIV